VSSPLELPAGLARSASPRLAFRWIARRIALVRVDVYRGTLAVLAVAAWALYALLDFQRYATFESAGYDVGNFDQGIRHLARFQAPVSSVMGVGSSLLGDHFSPILALLAPLFWIWPDTRMLGLVLGLLLAVSAFPVYAFCERRLGPGLGLLTAAAYLFWWPLQGIAQSDFHQIAFAVPLVAWLIDSLDRGRRGTVVAICLVLLLVREDMGFVLCMVAIILATQRQFRLAGALAIVGVLAFEVTTKLIIPGFNPDGTWQFWAYPALGPDLPSALIHIGTHPLGTARLLVSASAKRTLLVCLFLPPTLLALASPYVLLAIPILAERLLSDRAFLWTVNFQYNAILAPILVMATVDTLARIAGTSTAVGRMTRTAVILVFALTVVGGTVVASNLYPLRYLVVGQDRSTPARTRAAAEVLRRIPARVCVEADDRLIPHLIGRDYLVPPNGSENLASWLAVDTSQQNTGGGAEITPRARLAAARADGFVEVWSGGPMRLLHRAGPTSPLCRRVD
jgi:uncharacterized membrane protein